MDKSTLSARLLWSMLPTPSRRPSFSDAPSTPSAPKVLVQNISIKYLNTKYTTQHQGADLLSVYQVHHQSCCSLKVYIQASPPSSLSWHHTPLLNNWNVLFKASLMRCRWNLGCNYNCASVFCFHRARLLNNQASCGISEPLNSSHPPYTICGGDFSLRMLKLHQEISWFWLYIVEYKEEKRKRGVISFGCPFFFLQINYAFQTHGAQPLFKIKSSLYVR